MIHYRYLIIGGGMSANAAVQGIRSLDSQGSIAMISAEVNKPYDRPPLSKGLWKDELSVNEIVHSLPEDVKLITGRTVNSISIPRREVTDINGQSYLYEKLLLATGGTPRQLPFQADRQIIYYRTLEDYQRLRKLTEQYQRFIVIGGGFIGSELAAALQINGKEVALIFPESGICKRLFPTEICNYLNRYYADRGVQLHAGKQISNIQGALGDYQVQLESGELIRGDVIVAGIGIQPNTQLADAAGLQVDDGIIVNDSLQTSAPDIYAAGDVARFEDRVLGQWRRVEHEDNAVTMGKAAGRAMAGDRKPYNHSPMFYSDLFDLGYEAVGNLDSQLETFIDWQEAFKKGVIYYLRNQQLHGVLLWNVWDQTDAARQLIADGRQVTAANLRGLIQ